MKKVLLLFMVMLFTSAAFVSCTADEIEDEKITATDKEENCPPNDRNCNGIPDNQEN